MKQPTPDKQPDAVIQPAATVILLRPTSNPDAKVSEAFEVLLLQRNSTLAFASSQWVFPGGKIEEEDANGHQYPLAIAKQAAVRESAEEAGITLDANSFHYFAHFTGPRGEKKRFATWFLLSGLSEHQDIKIDDSEIVAYQWLTPSAALRQHQEGELNMLPPTFWSLQQLLNHAGIEQALQSAQAQEASNQVPHFEPRLVKQEQRLHVLLEDDCAYASGDLDLAGAKKRIVMGDSGWLWQHG